MVSNARILAEIQMKKAKEISKLQDFEIPGFLLPAIVYFENQDDDPLIATLEKELCSILLYAIDKQYLRLEWASVATVPEIKVFTGTGCEIKSRTPLPAGADYSLMMEFLLFKDIILQNDFMLNKGEVDTNIIFTPLIRNALRHAKRQLNIQNDLPLADLVIHIFILRFLEISHLAFERIVADKKVTFFNLKTPFYLIGNIENCRNFLIYSTS